MATVRVTIAGLTPMIQHNIRLANPLDPYARRLKSLTSKRNKTDEDLALIMEVEARGAAYETPEAYIGLPDAVMWGSIQSGAKDNKKGRHIGRALIYDPVRVPALTIDGETDILVDDFLKREGTIDYRPVRVQRAVVMRSRPIIYGEWQSTHEFELLTDVIQIDELQKFLDVAGRLHAVGDHRPQYGRYRTVEVVEVADAVEEAA